MDITVKPVLIPQLPERLVQKIHRVIRALEHAGAQKKALDIIAPVELHRQTAYLVRRKSRARHVVGTAVDTVPAVINTLIRKKDLQKGNASPVRREAVAQARVNGVAQLSRPASALHAAGGTGHVILRGVREDSQLFLQIHALLQ